MSGYIKYILIITFISFSCGVSAANWGNCTSSAVYAASDQNPWTLPSTTTDGTEFYGFFRLTSSSPVRINLKCNTGAGTYNYLETKADVMPPAGHAAGWYSVNEYLDIKIGSSFFYNKSLLPASVASVPFSDLEEGKNEVDSNGMVTITAANNARVYLYIKKTFLGKKEFFLPQVVKYYTNVSTDQYHHAFSSSPSETLSMLFSIIIPETCDFSANQTTNIDFGTIPGDDLSKKGKAVNGKTINFSVGCNILSSSKVTLMMKGTTVSGDSTVIQSDKKNIGIQLTDSNSKVISINNDKVPFTMTKDLKTGTTKLTVYPYNITGGVPDFGKFNATTTAEVDIN